MGPTNIALVKLYQADKALREAQERLDNASRSVRVQERRLAEFSEKHKLTHSQLQEQQSKAAQADLEIKTRDERIEKLRTQQQNSKSHKEYQTFLSEINTEKVDKGKFEDELLKLMEIVEKLQAEVKGLSDNITAEQARLNETKSALGGKLAELAAEVERLRPARNQAAKAVTSKALHLFERLAERFDGEALGSIAKPNRRNEEYICSACNMALVADVYNRLHSRDDLVTCPNCQRLLYIPDDLPVELAIHAKPPRKSIVQSSAAQTSQAEPPAAPADIPAPNAAE